jgi:hypothetical protein
VYPWPPVPDQTGQLVARVREDTSIDLMSLETGQLVGTIAPSSDNSVDRAAVTFTPRSNRLVSVTEGRPATLTVRDLSHAELVSAACDVARTDLSEQQWQLYVANIEPPKGLCPGRSAASGR